MDATSPQTHKARCEPGVHVAPPGLRPPGNNDPLRTWHSALEERALLEDADAEMELEWHEDLTGEFEHLAEGLAEGPANWLPGMYESPTGKITELQADTPFGELSRSVRVQLGMVERGKDLVVVPITWQSVDSEKLFPIFEGQLRLEQGTGGRNRLELKGRYVPPGGILGRAADTIVMNAVAQATAEDFVHRVGAIVERNALARTVSEQVEAGRLTLDTDP